MHFLCYSDKLCERIMHELSHPHPHNSLEDKQGLTIRENRKDFEREKMRWGNQNI